MKATIAVLAVWALSGTTAYAGGANNVTISRIEAEPNGHFFFYLSAPISGSPACASQPATGFVIDGTTAGGKVVLSLVETAYSLGKTVNMSGNGLCDVHAGFETIADISTTN